jgi:transcriptional regulator with XRE-family HTH domain
MKKENTAIRLKQIMSNENLRQVDILAKTMPYCKKYGVKMNKSDLSQYCSGKTEPNQDKLFVLSQALNVSEAWLMGFDVPKDREAFNKQWDEESEQFEDKINAFYYQLKGLGWSYKWLDSDKKYLLSNETTSIKITAEEYGSLVDSSEDFCRQQLQKLLLKSSSLLLAAHARTDTEHTSEDINKDLDIMKDDSKWE